LWCDSPLFQPSETGPEVGSTASNRSELYGLARLVSFHLLHLGIEVQNMDEPRLLAREDGADLGLESPKLTCVDGAGAVNRDTDLTDTFADNAWQVETALIPRKRLSSNTSLGSVSPASSSIGLMA
jgi:hypothetical protein